MEEGRSKMEEGKSKMEYKKNEKEFMEKQKRMHPISKFSSSHHLESCILHLES